MRVVRLLAAVVLAAAAALFAAPSASALSAGCAAAGLLDLPSGLCQDPVTGALSGQAGTVTPQRLTQTGGTLAAANGSGGTVAENAANAAKNGAISAAGKVGLLGRLGQAGTVLSAFSGGYWLGSQIASVLCASGASWECMPKPADSAGFVPNADVVLGDPGWSGGAQSMPLVNGTGGDGGVVTFSVAAADAGVPAGGVVPWADAFMVGNIVGGSGTVAFQGWAVDSSGASCRHIGSSVSLSMARQKVWSFADLSCGATGTYLMPDRVLFRAGSDSTAPVVLTWAAVGSSYRVVQDANPSRTLTATAQCVTVATGATFTGSASSAPFRETDTTWPAVPSVDCGPGAVAEGLSVKETTPNLPDKQIWQANVPAGVQSAITSTVCAGGKCRLSLVKIGPAGTDLGDCFEAAGRCENWFTDPARDQDYQCVYGLPGAMQPTALSDCYVYAPTFNPVQQAQGIGTADPATGDIPLSATGADPGESPAPGTDGSNCWPTGWGTFNPLLWIFQPIKCALVWAFVPTEAQMEGAVAPFQQGYEASSVASWLNAATGSLSAVDGGSGGACSAWTVPYPMASGGTQSLTILDPCEGPMATAAGVSRTVSSVLLVVLGAWACVRVLLGAGFGIRLGVGESEAAKT